MIFDDFLYQIYALSKYLLQDIIQDVKVNMVNSIILMEFTNKYFLDLKNSKLHKLFYDKATNISKNCIIIRSWLNLFIIYTFS